MMYGKIAAAALLTGSLAIGGYALAVETVPASQAQPGKAGDASALTVSQVIERLAALGYSDVTEIKRHRDKNYKVEARDPQGKRVELAVDAHTGDILKTEKDED